MVSRRQFLILAGSTAAAGVAVVAAPRLLSDDGAPEADLPTIRYGAEACARCGMLIDDVRFAAAWIEPGGREVHFDDIGCMVLEEGERPAPAATRYFTTDYETETWMLAEQASYVLSPDIHTPMAYGLAAAGSAMAAGRLSREHGGTVHLWRDLPEHIMDGGHR